MKENDKFEEEEILEQEPNEPRETMLLTFFSYEYTLVKGRDRNGKFPQPNFRDIPNFALKSIKKL